MCLIFTFAEGHASVGVDFRDIQVGPERNALTIVLADFVAVVQLSHDGSALSSKSLTLTLLGMDII